MIKNRKINIKHALIFLFATLLYALCQMLFSTILMEEDPSNDFFSQLASHYVVIITMCVGDYMLLLFLNKYLPYSKSIPLRIVADVIGVSLVCLIAMGLFNYLIYDVLLISKDGMPSFLVKFAFAMTNNIPILLAFELIYYFQSEQKAIADSEKAKREALNVLSSLIYMNPDNANKFTKALSKTYRYVLSLNRRPTVSIEEDLDALESYIFLMKMRFENSFTFTINKISDSGQHTIIPLTLQLLIENVFKHNVATEEMPLDIKITIDNEYITVETKEQFIVKIPYIQP